MSDLIQNNNNNHIVMDISADSLINHAAPTDALAATAATASNINSNNVDNHDVDCDTHIDVDTLIGDHTHNINAAAAATHIHAPIVDATDIDAPVIYAPTIDSPIVDAPIVDIHESSSDNNNLESNNSQFNISISSSSSSSSIISDMEIDTNHTKIIDLKRKRTHSDSDVASSDVASSTLSTPSTPDRFTITKKLRLAGTSQFYTFTFQPHDMSLNCHAASDASHASDASDTSHASDTSDTAKIIQKLINDLKSSIQSKDQSQSIHILKQLLSYKEFNVNHLHLIVDYVRSTILHKAAQLGLLDLVSFLILHAKACPLICDYVGDSPLYIAAIYGHIHVVSFLTNTNLTFKDVNQALSLASSKGYRDIVQHLIENTDVDPFRISKHGYNVLNHACRGGHLQTVIYLLKSVRINPNTLKHSPLNDAASGGHIHVVRYLIEKIKINPDTLRRSPLNDAADGGHLDIVRYFIQNCKIDPNLGIPLLLACRRGHHHVVKYLMDYTDADPNLQDIVENDTPLHAAVAYNHDRCVDILLSYDGIDTKLRNVLKYTAEGLAEIYKRDDMAYKIRAYAREQGKKQREQGEKQLEQGDKQCEQ